MLSNESVMVAFLQGKTAKNRNLTSFGSILVNYQTTIAQWNKSVVEISTHKYSRTTSKIQTQLRNAAVRRNITTTDIEYC